MSLQDTSIARNPAQLALSHCTVIERSITIINSYQLIVGNNSFKYNNLTLCGYYGVTCAIQALLYK